jgi:hypothetical protein
MCLGGRYIQGEDTHTYLPPTHIYLLHLYIFPYTHSQRERERERERERSEIHKRARRERERRERREGERMQRHSCALISVLLVHSFYRAILLSSGGNPPRGGLLQNLEL